MHLIQKILDNDLFRYRKDASLPLFIEIPCKKEFLPCLVSASRPDKFLEINRLTPELNIRAGVFQYDGARLDMMMSSLFNSAYELSLSKSFGNTFNDVKLAVAYVKKSSGLPNFPQQGLYPINSSEEYLASHGIKLDANGLCNGVKWNGTYVSKIVLLSRPDFVGIIHSLGRDHYSVLLHNVKLGMAFVG